MISIIVAMDANRVIGKNGKLPWHIPSDLEHFKKLTTNNTVVMGRKTFESLPMKNGLPNRQNIVVTKNVLNYWNTDRVTFIPSSAFTETELRKLGNEVFIIGGASIYEQAFPFVDRVYLSLIKGCVNDGDTFFPDVDWYDWRKVSDEDCGEYILRIMDRVK